MLSNKPYLLRAFYQWISDSACTPILVLDAHHPRCKVPRDYVEGDEIVFNISAAAIRDLKITNESIEFKASFSGVVHIISAPIKAILAIYAEENGEGLFFDAEEEVEDGDGTATIIPLKGVEKQSLVDASETSDIPPPVPPKSKPSLRLVE